MFGYEIFSILLSDNGTTEGGANWLSAISILGLFILVLFGAYFATKFLGNFQSNRMGNGNIKIIEAISVGPNKTIQIIKIGDDFVLIGVTRDRITFLKDIDESGLDLSRLDAGQLQSFSHYFNKLRKEKQDK